MIMKMYNEMYLNNKNTIKWNFFAQVYTTKKRHAKCEYITISPLNRLGTFLR